MSTLVSDALEQQVLTELRRHGIVVWLDKDASYTAYVDRLVRRFAEGDFKFPVVAFRGSFLELLLRLEPYGGGLEKQPLLIHMPGFTEESIRRTPVLELYEPGVRFRKNLDTLIRETATSRVAPTEVEAFLGNHPTLDKADAWLASAVSQSAVGLAAFLREVGRTLVSEALAKRESALVQRVTSDEAVATLCNYLHSLTGMDEAWLREIPLDRAAKPLDQTLDALSAWILCVEYVHDLRRPPHLGLLERLRDLSPPLVQACRELVVQLRKDSVDAYAQRADYVESMIEDEFVAMTPEDLGQVDTFRQEEIRVLEGAVEALRHAQWTKAKAWADARQGELSFWLQRDSGHRLAWSLVAEAAEFGAVLARHPRPLATTLTLEQAADAYATSAFEVDRAHRRFEQRRLAILASSLPHFGLLREVATSLRQMHRAWADQLGRDFTRICLDKGFLPESSLQQRTLYEHVVQPLVMTGEKVAYFLIDAFRFEMATELVDALKGPGTNVDLKPRLAELPSVTSVGMNALAPVATGGKLHVAGIFQGFKTGEFTVRGPDDRVRAMGARSAGKKALYLTLAQASDASTAELTKQVKPHNLIVVHSKEIDDAGEANAGIPTFESTLQQIKAAWHHLQLAGVKQFVFTADHGYLLQDETTVQADFGTKKDPQRRHILDAYPRQEPGMVNVSVSALGYEGIHGYLLFREDTAVFATGNPGASFVHGGNSPQERVIPVLTITRQRAEKGGLAEYVIEAETQQPLLGLNRVRLRVNFKKDSTTGLAFAAPATIDIALRVPGRNDIRVVLKDATQPAVLKAGRIQAPVGDTYFEVLFGLEGPADERVRLEVLHPDGLEKVQGAKPDAWYAVVGSAVATSSSTKAKVPSAPPPPSPALSGASWADGIEDEAVRKVFVHVDKHGAITEVELTAMLGSPRAARRFASAFESFLDRLPFRVRIESNDSGKRYVRESDR